MNEIKLVEENGQVVASSKQIADNFEKRHDNIVRDIKKYLNQGVLEIEEMFFETETQDSYGRKQRHYLVNRDGFSLLVMGFTGSDALRWKLDYINAFNQMEDALKNGTQLSLEQKAQLMLFSKDPNEIAEGSRILTELAVTEATKPLLETIEEQSPKVEYHDDVLNSDKIITVTDIAKDLGMSATGLNKFLQGMKIQYKQKNAQGKEFGNWILYAKYQYLITEGYADYKIDTYGQSLRWTEKGRKWIYELRMGV